MQQKGVEKNDDDEEEKNACSGVRTMQSRTLCDEEEMIQIPSRSATYNLSLLVQATMSQAS